MAAASRSIRFAAGLSVAVALSAVPVAAQTSGGGGSKPADASPLARGRWVLGALLSPPLPSSFGGSTGPAVGAVTTTGGATGGSSSSTVTAFGASGTVGYMVLANLDAGVRLGYAQTTVTVGSSNSSASGHDIGLYGRYWLPVGKAGAFQFGAQVSSRETSPPFAVKSTGIGPIIGYSLFLNKRVTFDMLIPVEFNTVSQAACAGCGAVPDRSYTSYGVAFGLSVFVP